jgi:hypothetical protein
MPAETRRREGLSLVIFLEVIDIIQSKRVQLGDPGVRAVRLRHDGTGLILFIHVHDYPGFVFTVFASPIRPGQKMRTGSEKDPDGIRNLDIVISPLFNFLLSKF